MHIFNSFTNGEISQFYAGNIRQSLTKKEIRLLKRNLSRTDDEHILAFVFCSLES